MSDYFSVDPLIDYLTHSFSSELFGYGLLIGIIFLQNNLKILLTENVIGIIDYF